LRSADEAYQGKLSALRKAISRELAAQLGRKRDGFKLFQDQDAISPGRLWAADIRAAIKQSVFFIPIVTPRAVKSQYCHFEFTAFLEREAELGRDDLVFPILYMDVRELHDDKQRATNPVLPIIAARQWEDWRKLRTLEVGSQTVEERVIGFCEKICAALYETWDSPWERADREAQRRREEAEALRLAELERQRLEAAEAERGTQARRLAEEEAQRGAKLEKIEATNLPAQAELLRPAEAEVQPTVKTIEGAEAEAAGHTPPLAPAPPGPAQVAQATYSMAASTQVSTDHQTEAASVPAIAKILARPLSVPVEGGQAATSATAAGAAEASRMAKAARRLTPWLMMFYFISYFERSYLSFARSILVSRHKLASSALFGTERSFVFAFVFFALPGVLILKKVGARAWLVGLALSWSAVAATQAFTQEEIGLYISQFLLGATHAAFVPGAIYLLTLWAPPADRARPLGLLISAYFLEIAISRPASHALRGLDGAMGLEDWQWMCAVSAALALLLALAAHFYLASLPEHGPEPPASQQRNPSDPVDREKNQGGKWRRSLLDPYLPILGLAYAGCILTYYELSATIYGVVRNFGLADPLAYSVQALPYLAGAVGAILWSWRSEAVQTRPGRTIAPLVLAAAGFAVAAMFDPAPVRLVCLSVAGLGGFAAPPAFWAYATESLGLRGAAAPIALVNSIGVLGAYFVWLEIFALRASSHDDFGGVTLAVGGLLIAAAIVFLLGRHRRLHGGPRTREAAR